MLNEENYPEINFDKYKSIPLLTETDIANEETNVLFWLSLNCKNSLLQIIHQTTELLTDLSHLTFTQKERLQKIHEAAKELLKSGERLKERIDRETD